MPPWSLDRANEQRLDSRVHSRFFLCLSLPEPDTLFLLPPTSRCGMSVCAAPPAWVQVASKFRSYLPPSLGFSVAPAEASGAAGERTSVKWCPREADGHECTDARCSQRHVAGKLRAMLSTFGWTDRRAVRAM